MPFRDTFDPGGPDGRLSRGDSNAVPGWGSHRLQSPGWYDSAAQGCLCSALPGTHGEAAGVPRGGPFLLESPDGDPFSFPFSSISLQKIPCQPGLKYMPAILALRDPRLARLRETLSHCPPVQTVPLCPHHTIGFCTLTDTQFCQSVRCPGLV